MHRHLLIVGLFFLFSGCTTPSGTGDTRNAPALEDASTEERTASSSALDEALAPPPKAEDATERVADGDSLAGADSVVEDADAGSVVEGSDLLEAADALADADADGGVDDSNAGEDRIGAPTKGEFHVLSRGEAPRHVLRYNFENMKRQSVRVRTDVDTEIEGQKMLAPRLIQVMHAKSLEARGDTLRITLESDKATYEARVQGDPMHDMVLESMQQMTDMTALTFRYDVDHFGNTENIKILSSSWDTLEVQEMIAGQMDQLTHGFPVEALGKGAQWTATSALNMGGEISMDVKVHYTLTSIDSEGAVLEIRMDVPNLSQAMNVEGAENAVMRGTLRGKGTMRVRFDEIFPTTDQVIDLDMVVEDGEKKMAMKMQMHMQLENVD